MLERTLVPFWRGFGGQVGVVLRCYSVLLMPGVWWGRLRSAAEPSADTAEGRSGLVVWFAAVSL
jgi:hypothetical protein